MNVILRRELNLQYIIKKITPTGYQPIRVNQERIFNKAVNREGFEPSTHGLKGRCSTS